MKHTPDKVLETIQSIADRGGALLDVAKELEMSRQELTIFCKKHYDIKLKDVWEGCGGQASSKTTEETTDKAACSIAKVEDKDVPVEDIQDPLEVLDLLKRAILRQDVDKFKVSQALKQVLHKYEIQNRLFLISAANAEMPRVLRLLTFLNDCEKEMFQPKRVKEASTKELSRLYALSQSNLLSSSDTIKKVADMRLEMLQAGGGVDGTVDSLFDPSADQELSMMSGMPGIDAQGRDRVRKIVSGLMSAIEKDNSVKEDDKD